MPCQYLKGVGPRLAERLAKLGIYNAQDLLFHLPFRYQDRTRIMPLRSLRPGMQASVEGVVELAEVVQRGRRSLLCRISDGAGFLTLRFFYFNKMQQQGLSRGIRLRCFGEVRFGSNGYEMIHPEYRCIDPDHPEPVEKYLTPVYPTTEGLHQLTFRKIIGQVLERLQSSVKKDGLQEFLPQEILQQYDFPNLTDALIYLHRPPTNASMPLLEEAKHPYQQRLVFEELLAHYLALRQLRAEAQQHAAIPLHSTGKLTQLFIEQLPFKLTNAQRRVSKEIYQDLTQSHPMLRLVQGDVGSGKTVVAILAALAAVESDCQVAVMAPTELLAEQHLKNFTEWLSPLGIELAWLSGQLKGKARQKNLELIKTGKAQIVIGTHALFQEGVEFSELALVVVDEQHRFGVHQRLALREKGAKRGHYPHQLIMTATPIPRTLAMSAYADLDHSIVDELPPGRKPVTTVVIPNERRMEVVERITQACCEQRQVYWVCTLIEESEVLQCQAAEKTAEKLMHLLPKLKVGLVHGRMKSKDKEEIMSAFKNKELDLLVATTVVEVGVDVPNASLMIIENPERLGLAQLHQLRGRVGRGSIESHCVLLYQKPLSGYAKERLAVMRKTNDGFVIAQKDLELRGPGEVLGTKQTGIVQMRIADILRDKYLFSKVQDAAELIMQKYPEIVTPLVKRWIVGPEKYGSV